MCRSYPNGSSKAKDILLVIRPHKHNTGSNKSIAYKRGYHATDKMHHHVFLFFQDKLKKHSQINETKGEIDPSQNNKRG